MRNRGDFLFQGGFMLEVMQEYKQQLAMWALVIGLSVFGGLADAIMRYQREGIRLPLKYFLIKIFCDLFIAAFAGVLAFFGVWHFTNSYELTPGACMAISLSGYLGGNAINIFASIWEAAIKTKTGGMQ